MDADNTPALPTNSTPEDNRRRHGRIRARELRTRLGEVADLSASGMRIICNRPEPPELQSIVQLDLRHPEGSLPVKARVVWIKQGPTGQCELGLIFEDVNPSIAAGLVAIARLALQSVAAELQHDDPDLVE